MPFMSDFKKMSEKIRFAMIGVSGMAHAHVKAIQNNKSAAVACVYSRDPARAQEFAGCYDISVAKSYEEILADKSINAVDIVTEPHRHAELALLALKNKKHVLIEKPLDIDFKKAIEVSVTESKHLRASDFFYA